MKKLVVIVFVIATSSVFAQAKKKSPIDGKIFTITLTPQEEKKKAEPQKDEVSFMLGKCKSVFMGQAGVAAQADYEYEIDSTSGKAIVKFTVESKNEETQERFSWEGSVDDDKIAGTLTTRKKGKVVTTYNFVGTQKNKKKAKPQPKPVAVPKDSTVVEQPKTE